MTETPADYLRLNRAAWDELTAHHLRSPFYKVSEFRADRIPWKGLPQLVQTGEHYWALPPELPKFPLAFALSAVKA